MNVGVIGVGIQGERHVRVYSDLKNVDSVTIFDNNPDIISNIIKKYDNIRVAVSTKKLMETVDAVSICTPTPTHYNFVVDALAFDTPFLVEKPLTDSYIDAECLVNEYNLRHSHLTCGVGHIERFNPIVNEISKLIYKPKYIEIKRHNPSSARTTGVSNVIDDLMIHDIDILLNVFFKEMEYEITPVGNSDVCGCGFKIITPNDEDVSGYISASRKSAKKIRTIYVEDDQWTIDGNYINQEVYVHRRPSRYEIGRNLSYTQENVVDKVDLGKIEPLRVELSTFLNSVLTGDMFPITLSEAAKNVKICEEIKKGVNIT